MMLKLKKNHKSTVLIEFPLLNTEVFQEQLSAVEAKKKGESCESFFQCLFDVAKGGSEWCRN